jgi:hypothetical protein
VSCSIDCVGALHRTRCVAADTCGVCLDGFGAGSGISPGGFVKSLGGSGRRFDGSGVGPTPSA